MSNEEERANDLVTDLATARRAVEEGRLRVKELTENVGEAMTANNNKEAGAILRERNKAQRELDRMEETLRALEEGQSNEA